MGSQSAKVFQPPTSYGAVQSPGTVSQVTPQGINAPTTLLPDQAGAGLGAAAPATPATPVRNQGGSRGKFFSDREFDGIGQRRIPTPRKPIIPPPPPQYPIDPYPGK